MHVRVIGDLLCRLVVAEEEGVISMRRKPLLFVGSSTEGLEIARAVRRNLEDAADVNLWNEGELFALSRTMIESLEGLSTIFDFAVLILTPDDLIRSRGTEEFGPRDNVILELGMMIARIGRYRTFIVRPRSPSFKLPSDLSGMVTAEYDPTRAKGDPEGSVGVACDRIRRAIQRSPSAVGSSEQITKRSDRPDWRKLGGRLLDTAILTRDQDSYVDNPVAARQRILECIKQGNAIPTQYHYASDVMASLWVHHCREVTYRHQRNTVNFWRSPAGQHHADKILKILERRSGNWQGDVDFISLGPGDGEKDAFVLGAWRRAGADVRYYPYDISAPMVQRAVDRVRQFLGADVEWPVTAVLADFSEVLAVSSVFADRSAPNVIGLFGNLGNMMDDVGFLAKLRRVMGPEDLLMLEVRVQSDDSPIELAGGKSLQHDFGPLEHYLGMTFDERTVAPSYANDKSDVPGTQTIVVTYNGEVPDLGDQQVTLQYIHLYDPDQLLEELERQGFAVEFTFLSSTDPPFLDCVLSRDETALS